MISKKPLTSEYEQPDNIVQKSAVSELFGTNSEQTYQCHTTT